MLRFFFFVQPSAVEDAEPSGKASSEGGETLDPVAEQMFVEKALPRTVISEAPATSKEITTALCCAIERASALVSGNPLRSDLLSSSKHRVLKHDLFEKQHVMGHTVEAEHLGVSKRLLPVRHDTLRAIKQVHEQLIAYGEKARLCAEHLRFDETTMKMRLRDPERPIAPDSGHDAQQQQPGSVVLPILETYTSCHVAKILQTERSISLLYVLPNGKALHFRFRLPTHLQCLSPGEAETYFRALGDSRLQLPSAMTENFTHRLHLHRWRPCTRSLHQGFRFVAREV